MKKLILLCICICFLSSCLQSLTLGIYNKIEIADNDTVTTTTGDISDTELDVGALP